MKIIAAVSGGVDSTVMLHKLVAGSAHEVIVAHFDHAMRKDSRADARFVEGLADLYGLEFESKRTNKKLHSESDAREARWRFLKETAEEKGVDKIATGHHQDDVLETMILNIMRGTGRSGLSSLKESDSILRPNLTQTKEELYRYALENELEWVEDESNASDEYERNRVRRYVIPKLNYFERDSLLRLNEQSRVNNEYLDTLLGAFVENNFEVTEDFITGERADFVLWPYALRKEVIRTCWLMLKREDINRRHIEKFAVAAATARHGSNIDGSKYVKLHIDKTNFTLYLKK